MGALIALRVDGRQGEDASRAPASRDEELPRADIVLSANGAFCAAYASVAT